MASAAPSIDVFLFTDKGQRESQEDYYYTGPVTAGTRAWLGIVADGMGGHLGGAAASQAGVSAIRQAFESTVGGAADISKALAEATRKGQEAVVRAATEAGAFGNMGSTVVAFAVRDGQVFWCSAGDSRLYLCRRQKVVQLTHDFTLGEEMRQQTSATALFTPEEIEANPRRNALTSFMGTDHWKADSGSTELMAGDVLVACSDGVWGTLGNDGILAAAGLQAGRATAEEIAAEMQRLVRDAGKTHQDNATAIVVRWKAPGGQRKGGPPFGFVFAGASAVVVALALSALAWTNFHPRAASLAATSAVEAPPRTTTSNPATSSQPGPTPSPPNVTSPGAAAGGDAHGTQPAGPAPASTADPTPQVTDVAQANAALAQKWQALLAKCSNTPCPDAERFYRENAQSIDAAIEQGRALSDLKTRAAQKKSPAPPDTILARSPPQNTQATTNKAKAQADADKAAAAKLAAKARADAASEKAAAATASAASATNAVKPSTDGAGGSATSSVATSASGAASR